MLIYEPKGKAREYSPLAMNLYSGCDHGCKYCYVPKMMQSMRASYDHKDLKERARVIALLEKEAPKKRGCQQVLMSFTTDPYNGLDQRLQLTRQALSILLPNDIPVAILSKGGKRILRDLDLFKQFGRRIKVGGSLTYTDPKESARVEPGAALPQERFAALRILHSEGIRTWVSLEPVIRPDETLEIIDATKEFVDEYKVGKLNHYALKIDWHDFLVRSVTEIREAGKPLYVKNDLAEFAYGFDFLPHERNMDFLAVKAEAMTNG